MHAQMPTERQKNTVWSRVSTPARLRSADAPREQLEDLHGLRLGSDATPNVPGGAGVGCAGQAVRSKLTAVGGSRLTAVFRPLHHITRKQMKQQRIKDSKGSMIDHEPLRTART
jgi:hypothetical protein